MMTKDQQPSRIVILSLTFLAPLCVLPGYLENPFFAPKALLILTGVSLLTAAYGIQFVRGAQILVSGSFTPFWIILLVLLNFISFFYTQNYYYTKVAAVMNVSCLLFFYFVSIQMGSKDWPLVLWAAALAGVLVSGVAYLQFGGIHFHLSIDDEAVGTMGNPNYLGAYTLFPLFALSGLVFLLKGKLRLLALLLLAFVFGILLMTRARAACLGLCIAFPLFLMLLKRIYRFSLSGYVRSNPKRMTISVSLMLILVFLLFAMPITRFHSKRFVNKWTDTSSLEMRMKYFLASWWLFKESPLFGTGLWSFRNRVYDAQAEINKKDADYFKDYKKPKPRRVHNEYLEILNDGGLVAGALLLTLFLTVMGHGWGVIRRRETTIEDRIIAATAFSAIVAVMGAALFFFPFRLRITLFMTALMLGILEGIYLRNYSRLLNKKGKAMPLTPVISFLIATIFLTIVFYEGYRPFRGEREYFRYKKSLGQGNTDLAEKHILKALSFDPRNTLYCLYTGSLYMDYLRDDAKAGEFFDRAIADFNGDVCKWDVYFYKGALEFNRGSFLQAREAFEKSLYYNPNFLPARNELKEVEKMLNKENKRQ